MLGVRVAIWERPPLFDKRGSDVQFRGTDMARCTRCPTVMAPNVCIGYGVAAMFDTSGKLTNCKTARL